MTNEYHPHPLLNEIYKLAFAPTYKWSEGFHPHKASPEDWDREYAAADAHNEQFIKPQTERVFQLMDQYRVMHPPRLKAQYDRGMMTAPEYASLLSQHLTNL